MVDAITNDGGKMIMKDDGTLEAEFDGDSIEADATVVYDEEPTIITTEDGGTVNTETGEYMDPLFTNN